MKCINRTKKILCLVLGLILLTGCSGVKYDMAYDPDYPVSSFCVTNYKNVKTAKAFSDGICVVKGDVATDDNLSFDNIGAAGLFSLSDNRVIYASNIHSKVSPASLTKLMTALTALKYGSLDQVLTATENVYMSDPNAQTFNLVAGDQMTLNQALHILLINSANDVANLIAENIGGSIEEFCNMMNDTAKSIGATNSNFVNPSGLTADNHYTTSYDLYLIMNAVLKYEEIRDIISKDSYTTVYNDAQGRQIESTVKTTNQYLNKVYSAPGNITVIGGKTGTTNSAGNCLILLVKDTAGNQYISIIMRAAERGILYNDMNILLSHIS